MSTVTIRFINSTVKPYHVQIDPWAGYYTVRSGQQLVIIAESDEESVDFDLDEHDDLKILTICNSEDYFIERNGARVHYREFPADFDD